MISIQPVVTTVVDNTHAVINCKFLESSQDRFSTALGMAECSPGFKVQVVNDLVRGLYSLVIGYWFMVIGWFNGLRTSVQRVFIVRSNRLVIARFFVPASSRSAGLTGLNCCRFLLVEGLNFAFCTPVRPPLFNGIEELVQHPFNGRSFFFVPGQDPSADPVYVAGEGRLDVVLKL